LAGRRHKALWPRSLRKAEQRSPREQRSLWKAEHRSPREQRSLRKAEHRRSRGRRRINQPRAQFSPARYYSPVNFPVMRYLMPDFWVRVAECLGQEGMCSRWAALKAVPASREARNPAALGWVCLEWVVLSLVARNPVALVSWVVLE